MLFLFLAFYSLFSAYPGPLSCHATIAKVASSVSKAAARMWAQRTNLLMMSTARWKSVRSAGVPCLVPTGAAATAASTGREIAQWIAMEWCHSSARGRVDAFCLR